jgi:NAD(P)-dependent dehydrogenase (short-subunit alcohol dehydrogenase family)
MINTVHPGFVDSPMMNSIERMINPESSKSAQEDLLKLVPLGRYATPKDVSKLVAFLFSDDAAYITGSQYVTDGGVVG